jgi:hypothetical protein
MTRKTGHHDAPPRVNHGRVAPTLPDPGPAGGRSARAVPPARFGRIRFTRGAGRRIVGCAGEPADAERGRVADRDGVHAGDPRGAAHTGCRVEPVPWPPRRPRWRMCRRRSCRRRGGVAGGGDRKALAGGGRGECAGVQSGVDRAGPRAGAGGARPRGRAAAVRGRARDGRGAGRGDRRGGGGRARGAARRAVRAARRASGELPDDDAGRRRGGDGRQRAGGADDGVGDGRGDAAGGLSGGARGAGRDAGRHGDRPVGAVAAAGGRTWRRRSTRASARRGW